MVDTGQYSSGLKYNNKKVQFREPSLFLWAQLHSKKFQKFLILVFEVIHCCTATVSPFSAQWFYFLNSKPTLKHNYNLNVHIRRTHSRAPYAHHTHVVAEYSSNVTMQIRRLSKGQPSFEKKGHYKGRRTRIITSKGRRRRPQQQARRHQLVPDFMKVVILQYYTCGLCATDYLYYCYMLQRDYHGLLLRPLQAAKGHHQTVDRSSTGSF